MPRARAVRRGSSDRARRPGPTPTRGRRTPARSPRAPVASCRRPAEHLRARATAARGEGRRRWSYPDRDGDADAGGTDEERRASRSRARRLAAVTSSLSCSTRAGPMPGTSSRSSTEPNGPCAVRQSTIFCAVTGPIPGSSSSCSRVAIARLTFTAPAGEPRRRRARRPPLRDEHLLPVGERRGEVHHGQVSPARRTTRPAERVGYPGALSQPEEARSVDGADDVHHESWSGLCPARFEGGERCGRRGSRRSRPGRRDATRPLRAGRRAGPR